MKVFDTAHEAYLACLEDVMDCPDFISQPRGMETREILDYSFRILYPSMEPIETHDQKRNRVIADYTKKEVDLYNSKTNKAEDFGKASKFWLKLANPDGTVNSAYGHLIWGKESHGSKFETALQNHLAFPDNVYVAREVKRTPWEWAKESLIRDIDTRQAILRFNLPEHAWFGNKDFTCTMHGMFTIRDNKLNLSINMRSNDLMLGMVYDIPWFISLIYKMRRELSDVYPNLKIGHYTHTVHSLHIYARDFEKVEKMLGRQ